MAFMLVFLAFIFVFLDSFQLMTSILYRLAANLPTDAFIYTSHVFQGEKLAFMKQTKKVFIPMITWIVKRNFMTSNCRPKIFFIAC